MGGLPLIFKNKTELQDEKENVTQNTLNTCLLETREKNGLYCSCFFCWQKLLVAECMKP